MNSAQYQEGTQIGKYTVVGVLGEGGIGTVYIGKHPLLERKVAIKVLNTHGARDDELLYSEARVLAGLRHPNIVTLHDAGEHEGCAYVVMDMIEGRSLGQIVRSGDSLPMLVLLRIMAKIADAMQHAHEKGVIHRNISPANIILGPLGEPVLIDFALSLSSSGYSFRQDAIIGTAGYMSPEQAEGSAPCVSARSDIWGLGATLYDLISGRPPYQGKDSWEVLQQVASQDPVNVSPLSGKAPEYVAHIARRCLEKNPAERYESAEELRRALEAAIEQIEMEVADTMLVTPPKAGRTLLLHVEYEEADLPGAFREYEIEAYLGSGTFGEVYQARETPSGRHVALKILKREWVSNQEAVTRFRREALVLSRLAHPNIVKVWNFGRYGATFFIAMELLRGRTLREVIETRAPMNVAGALSFILPTLRGVVAMHEAGVVHRDLKPSNIGVEGRSVLVCDFGVARGEELEKLTMTGVFIGTANYASPEQARGEPATRASDVYAVGVILYELLSARRPHEGRPVRVLLDQIASEPPARITAYREDLPPELERILDRLLAKDRTDRPSASEAERALAGLRTRA